MILVDDLIATGGTAEGAVKLLRQIGAQVEAACFIVDLPDLGGAEKLGPWRAGAHHHELFGPLSPEPKRKRAAAGPPVSFQAEHRPHMLG